MIERAAAGFRKTDADGIDAVIENDGSGGGFAFENGGGVDGDFFRSEAGASGGGGIDLKSGSGAADGVFHSVENIDHAGNFADGLGDARSGLQEKLLILRIKFDDHRFGFVAKVADHVLQNLNEVEIGGGFGFFDFAADVADHIVDVAGASSLIVAGQKSEPTGQR